MDKKTMIENLVHNAHEKSALYRHVAVFVQVCVRNDCLTHGGYACKKAASVIRQTNSRLSGNHIISIPGGNLYE